MTIKILEKTSGCNPVVFVNGEWFDLCTAEDVTLRAPEAHKMHTWKRGKEGETVKIRDVDFDSALIKMGVAMEVPEGFEAILAPRSSTFKKYGLIQVNSIGVIDNSFNGDNDEWLFPVLATRKVTIPKGTRLAQFRIQLSQKASCWQKIKWLFSSGVKLKRVTTLKNPTRGGFGSTDNN